MKTKLAAVVWLLFAVAAQASEQTRALDELQQAEAGIASLTRLQEAIDAAETASGRKSVEASTERERTEQYLRLIGFTDQQVATALAPGDTYLVAAVKSLGTSRDSRAKGEHPRTLAAAALLQAYLWAQLSVKYGRNWGDVIASATVAQDKASEAAGHYLRSECDALEAGRQFEAARDFYKSIRLP